MHAMAPRAAPRAGYWVQDRSWGAARGSCDGELRRLVAGRARRHSAPHPTATPGVSPTTVRATARCARADLEQRITQPCRRLEVEGRRRLLHLLLESRDRRVPIARRRDLRW